jgi:chromosome segregation ATPase
MANDTDATTDNTMEITAAQETKKRRRPTGEKNKVVKRQETKKLDYSKATRSILNRVPRELSQEIREFTFAEMIGNGELQIDVLRKQVSQSAHEIDDLKRSKDKHLTTIENMRNEMVELKMSLMAQHMEVTNLKYEKFAVQMEADRMELEVNEMKREVKKFKEERDKAVLMAEAQKEIRRYFDLDQE